MAPTDSTDRITFWQDHVTAWQVSDLTQKAYCEHEELRYSTFGYWDRKLRRVAEPTARARPSGFVPVIPGAVQPTGLNLSLPNGLEIRGIEVQNLPVVKQLLAVL